MYSFLGGSNDNNQNNRSQHPYERSCRVCAAVSALTCNLINSLKDLTGDRIRGETASGMTVIEWEDLSDGGKLLVDSWFLGIAVISQEYNCIQFE